jgi:hypothetical protein
MLVMVLTVVEIVVGSMNVAVAVVGLITGLVTPMSIVTNFLCGILMFAFAWQNL